VCTPGATSTPVADPRERQPGTQPDGADTLEGTIVDVTQRSLTLRVGSGAPRVLTTGDLQIDVAHLRDHSSLALPVRVTLGEEGTIVGVEDVPPRSADEKRRAAGLPSPIARATFDQLRVGMTEAETSRIAGLPLYRALPGRRATEHCSQWQQLDGPRTRYYEACFDAATATVVRLDPAAT
jgi:hypothetical protein